MDLIKPNFTREVNKKLLQSNNSTLKSFDHPQNVWVRNHCRAPKWVRGTFTERTGPVLNKVKVNDQIWKRHVKHLQDSSLCPPEMGRQVIVLFRRSLSTPCLLLWRPSGRKWLRCPMERLPLQSRKSSTGSENRVFTTRATKRMLSYSSQTVLYSEQRN